MTAAPFITEEDLAKLWRVNPESVARLRRRGELTPDGRIDSMLGKPYAYLPRTIDAFHQSRSQAPHGSLPEVLELIAGDRPHLGDRSLLTQPEASDRLGSDVRYALRTGRLGAIFVNPGRIIRIPRGEVPRFLAAYTDETVIVPPTVAARLLCASTDTVRELIDSGHLEHAPTTAHRSAVTRASLRALLAQQLRNSATVDNWWLWVETLRCDVSSKQQLVRRLGVGDKSITRALERGELPALLSTGGHWHIPLCDALLETPFFTSWGRLERLETHFSSREHHAALQSHRMLAQAIRRYHA